MFIYFEHPMKWTHHFRVNTKFSLFVQFNLNAEVEMMSCKFQLLKKYSSNRKMCTCIFYNNKKFSIKKNSYDVCRETRQAHMIDSREPEFKKFCFTLINVNWNVYSRCLRSNVQMNTHVRNLVGSAFLYDSTNMLKQFSTIMHRSTFLQSKIA